jgi:hypothetical protein
VSIAGFDRMPLASSVLEPTSPLGNVGAMLGVASPILGLDEPEALVRLANEALGVVSQLGHCRQGKAGE